jgi:hypothetical protein
MGKESIAFLWRALALLAAAAATMTAQEKRPTCDLGGAVGAHRGERVRVTVWHDDGRRVSMKMMAEGFAERDGTFEFADLPWFAPNGWGSSKVVVVARSRTRVGLTAVRGVRMDPGNLHIAMKRKVDVRGVLTDARTGKPVQHGWIWPTIFEQRPQVWVTEPLLPWRAETDERGRFVLRGMPEGIPVKALAGGRDHARTWVDLGDAVDHHRFALQPGGRIEGRVLKPDGTPAARVQVETTSRGTGRGHTRTDDQGRFTLTSLERGEYKVWAEVPELTVVAALGIDVQPGETSDCGVVQLVRGGFIVGRITDATTGKPIAPGPQTDVAMYGPARGAGGSCQCTPVQPDGTFRIRAPAGRNRIYLRAANGYNEPSEFVDVVEGEEVLVEWKLNRR